MRTDTIGRCDGCGTHCYDSLVAYIACTGDWPNDINEEYQAIVRSLLEFLGKTEDEFAQDVQTANLMTE